jgi:hypothetical protein
MPSGARSLSLGYAHGFGDAVRFDRCPGYAHEQVDYLFLVVGYG